MKRCIRHESCRRALRSEVAAWPTATYPRTFITITLGSLGGLALLALGVADIYAFCWMLTQTVVT